MPFREVSVMSSRLEFVLLANTPGTPIRPLCRRFGISPDTAYRLLKRYREGGTEALADRSRRPHHCPQETSKSMTERILALRQKHPSWGGRKLMHRLRALAATPEAGIECSAIPAASTISGILRRSGQLNPENSRKHTAFVRFERSAPNELWQMDFKGPMPSDQGDCHPLTVLDDHSRFNLLLEACGQQTCDVVQSHLTQAFRHYGLPRQLLTDNGPPWGVPRPGAGCRLTRLGVWLIRLGIDPIHGRPAHPQTQGKEERFHRTLLAEVPPGRPFASIEAYRPAFREFRESYNLQRPHEALGMATPVSRYEPSPRSFPETLPPVQYAPGDQVRKVLQGGEISFQGRRWFISGALSDQHVALRPTLIDGQWDVFFCTKRLATLDQNTHNPK
jgi:transposase InsO family protein